TGSEWYCTAWLRPTGIRRPEIERTEIDGVIRREIGAVKRDAHETLLRDILAADIDVDGAVAEVDSRPERDPLACRLAQSSAFPRAVDERRGRAVEQLQALAVREAAEIGRERFGLTGRPQDGRETEHAGIRRDDELTSVHDVLRPLYGSSALGP